MKVHLIAACGVGMSALAISTPRRLPEQVVDFPEEEVLIG